MPIAKHQTTTNPDQKSYLAEKSIATIRAKLYRYSTFLDRKVDISQALPYIIESVNNTPNTVTGFTPLEGEQLKNAGPIFRKKYAKYFKKKLKASADPPFPLNTFVRISIPDQNSF